MGLVSDGGSDVSVPTRVWASAAGSAFEEPVMAVGDRTRTCYLCFIPDHYILGCPQLTLQQREMAHQKRLAFSQIEKPFGSGDVPSGVDKPHGQVDRPYGQSYGYSRRLASNRVYSDALHPFVAQFGEFPMGVAIGAMQRPMGRR
jgi:hypothetical protein